MISLIKKTNRGHGYSEEATITRLIFKDGNYVELSDLYTDLDKSSLTKIAKFFDIILVDKEEDKPEDVFLKNFPHSNNVDLEMIKDIKEEMSNYGINFDLKLSNIVEKREK